MTKRITDEEMYAIKYIDSGGNPEKFSHRHKKLKKAIMNEAKRRLMVELRHKASKSSKMRNKIYKIMKISPKQTLTPEDFYEHLVKVSYSRLKDINKSLLQ